MKLSIILNLQNKGSMTYDHFPVTFVKPGAANIESSLVYCEQETAFSGQWSINQMNQILEVMQPAELHGNRQIFTISWYS